MDARIWHGFFAYIHGAGFRGFEYGNLLRVKYNTIQGQIRDLVRYTYMFSSILLRNQNEITAGRMDLVLMEVKTN